MRCLRLAIFMTAAAVAQHAGTARSQQGEIVPPSTEEFARLHAELCPKSKGKWEAIPWTIDLLAARRRAIAEKKPLFMWSMNGHPLGCT